MKRKHVYMLVTALILFISQGYAQQVGINEDGSAPHPNAILDVKSLNKGMLIPRMSTANRLAISPTKGLLVYDTTTQTFWYNTGTAWQNIAISAGWSLNGNSGTNATNFLGTTDDTPLRMKVFNLPAGLIDRIRSNTFFGIFAGQGDPLPNAPDPTGFGNTGIGSSSLSLIDQGIGNTAIGYSSLFDNGSGNRNTAIGYHSLSANQNGHFNTGVGYFSLRHLIGGISNIAIGANSGVPPFIGEFFDNTVAIGVNAFVNNNNKIRIGNSATTAIEGPVPFTTPSDKRFKYSVQEDVKGLDFILQLRPVTYQFDAKRFDEQFRRGLEDTLFAAMAATMDAGYTEAAAIRRSGFIAQEVEQAAMDAGYNFSGLLKPKTAQEHYSLSYESFVVPLVKGMQELHLRLEKMEKENAALKQELLRMRRSN